MSSIESQWTCESCGGHCKVIEDNMEICEECGVVSTGQMNLDFTSDFNEYIPTIGRLNTNLPAKYGTALKRISPGLLNGIAKTKFIGRKMDIAPEIIKKAVNIFEQIYEDECVKNKHDTKKKSFCAACVFIALRLQDSPVLQKDVCLVADVKLEQMISAKRFICTKLDIELTAISPEDLCSQLCRDILSKEELTSLKCLVDLCRNSWITQGHSLEAIIASVAFVIKKAYSKSKITKTSFHPLTRNRFIRHKRLLHAASVQQLIQEHYLDLPWISSDSSRRRSLSVKIDALRQRQRVLNLKTQSQILPKCFVKENAEAKPRPPEVPFKHDLDDPELNSNDLSQRECGQYLRSENEVEIIAQHRRRYKMIDLRSENL